MIDKLKVEELEAFRDERGWNTHPVDEAQLAAGGFSNIHLVSMEPGTIRGNHRHFEQTEQVLIIGGPCLFVAADRESGEKFERVFQPGELFRITLAPGLPHAFKNIGDSVCYLLCASDVAFDPENPDTIRDIVID
ncbi:MAG TPA: cupin domain-containing protein [bacterium]|nr:cupin domain-containing protein [bacterium]